MSIGAPPSDNPAAQPMAPSDLVELYGAFQGRLERIVRGSVWAQSAVIEDACQIAWVGLIARRERMDLPSAPGWLVRTAIHEAVRIVRLESREDSLELARDGQTACRGHVDLGPESQIGSWDRMDSLRRLPSRQQRLVWLRALGLSHEEIACHERCTSRTVRRQLERANHTLRRFDGSASIQAAA